MSDANTGQIMDYMKEVKNDLGDRIDKLDKKVDRNHKDIKDSYVTKEAFAPIQRIVYGLIGTALTVLLIALLGLVVISGV